MLLQEGDELALGGHYWMQDDTGDEVWRLGEVLERGEGGNVSIKLESGGVIDIDPVRRPAGRRHTSSLLTAVDTPLGYNPGRQTKTKHAPKS